MCSDAGLVWNDQPEGRMTFMHFHVLILPGQILPQLDYLDN